MKALLVAFMSACALLAVQGKTYGQEPPVDMVKPSVIVGAVAKAVRTDLKRSWYDWNSLEMQVIIKRRERKTENDDFHEHVQELSTSFYVTDVRWRCDGEDEINELFVAGVNEDGSSVVERWKFYYTAPVFDENGRYITIDNRRLPSVRRKQVYRGSSLGRIRTLQPDPDGRFVLFVTRETPTLYRIDLPSGVPSVALDQSVDPFLSNVGVVGIRKHASEGIQYHLYAGTRWHYDSSVPGEVIVLRDGDNDGVLDAPELVTPVMWEKYGYNAGSSWVKFCP